MARDDDRWMLYGATGYTGQLVAEQAVERGHRPLLAGRNEEVLRKLGRRLNLKYVAFDLSDLKKISQHSANVELVYHAAGPFTHTSDPMIRACLATHTHYVDITGEIGVFENTFGYDDVARKNGVALISGVGFDVIPSDCLAAYVAQQVPNAQTLEIGVQALSSMSAGTAKSALEMLQHGASIRRNGQLTSQALGSGARNITFSNGTKRTMPVPWGDISTAYRTTHIPNITTYMPFPPAMIQLARLTGGIGQMALSSPSVRGLLGSIFTRTMTGPNAATREFGKSYLWAQASNNVGQSAEAWLETADGYQFTALAAIPVIEKVLELRPSGALTPAQAFGADFVLEIPGTFRSS